jgi:hypothetical protein
MQLVIRSAPDRGFDAGVPRVLVEAIARDLWRLYGVSGRLDWAGVERHLRSIVEEAVELAAADSLDPRSFLVSVT